MRNLTCQQLYNACKNHQFIILRYSGDNSLIAINCKIVTLKKFDKFKTMNSSSDFISFIPCGFMEYISKKFPFF